MRRRVRPGRWLFLLLCLLLAVLLFCILRMRMVPIIRELAKTRVSNESSFAINRAVQRQIDSNSIAYDRIVLFEKDAQGNVRAIRTNMAEVNRLKTEVLAMVDEEVLELSVTEIGIPLGSVLLPEIFSGRGPRLPVSVLSVSNSDAMFQSSFTEAGINQTLHRILLTINATMTILTPLGTQNVTADAQMVVAETLIVGTVPNTYLNLGQLSPSY